MSKDIVRTVCLCEMVKPCFCPTTARRKRYGVRTVFLFDFLHFFGNKSVSFVPTDLFPLSFTSLTHTHNGFNQTLRIIQLVKSCTTTRTDFSTSALIRRITANKHPLAILYPCFNGTRTGTHFTDTRRKGCFSFVDLFPLF